MSSGLTRRPPAININLIILCSIFSTLKLIRVIPVKIIYVIRLCEVFENLIFSCNLVYDFHVWHTNRTGFWTLLLLLWVRILAIFYIFVLTAPGRIIRQVNRCRYHDALSRADLPPSFIRDCAHPGWRGIRPLLDVLYGLFLDRFLPPLMIVDRKVVLIIC